MDEKKEFLTEENYKRANKKIKIIAIAILLIGIILGGSLIAVGIVKSSKVETPKVSEKDAANIQAEIDEINDELASLQAQQNKEFDKNGFSEEFYKLENEIKNKTQKVTNLKSKITNDAFGFKDTEAKIKKSKSIPFYMFGGFIIVVSCMMSGSVYMFSKRRELLSYSVQQVMPVAQEGIEKVAPTIGKAGATIAKEMAPVYGEMAKEISKGIKEGIKSADVTKEDSEDK